MKASELLSETMVLLGGGPLFRKGRPIRPRSVGYSKSYIMKPAVPTDVKFCLS